MQSTNEQVSKKVVKTTTKTANIIQTDDSTKKQTIKTTCCYCGVGCGVIATMEDSQLTMVEGDKDHPSNYGRLCVKGSSLHETQNLDRRLSTPLLHGKPSNWETALNYSSEKFKAIIDEHGPDSVAFYVSGQILTEDYYVANKLMKGFIGSSNIDTNSRLCMASPTTAHRFAFGGDIVPGCYEDLELADTLLLVGSNMAYAHPVIFQRIVAAKEARPDMRIVILDPRRTPTCDLADIHIPLKAGSDGFFFNGLLAWLADNNYVDNEYISQYTDGFDSALHEAKTHTPSIACVAKQCDVPEALILDTYRLFANSAKTVTAFSQGINQSSSGTDKVNAIINCHLATGKIGTPGNSPFSITGQPNAMGGREVGGLANQLAAHMRFDTPEDVDRVAEFWQAKNMSRTEGKKAIEMMHAMHEGKIKAIWIMATNPVVSMPDADFFCEALERCELVMVSEATQYSDTAQYADVVFPATAWGEKIGTVTNAERTISLQKGFLEPVGQAKHDWEIISLFAEKLGWGDAFDYTSPADIFREHAALSELPSKHERAFNIGYFKSISDEAYLQFNPVQWPVTETSPEGTARLFSDKKFFTPNKRAQFISNTPQAPKVKAEAQQFILNTGRIRDQWHTMTKTGGNAKLINHTDEPFIDIHPDNAATIKVKEGELLTIKNRGARFIGRCHITTNQRVGDIFVPIHWNRQFSSLGRIGAVINPIVDPFSGQPEFKQSPVNVERYQNSWHGVLVSQHRVETNTDYWVNIPFDQGFKYRISDEKNVVDWRQWIRKLYPEIDDWIDIVDSSQQFYRAAGFKNDILVATLIIHPSEKSIDENTWLENQIGELCLPADRPCALAGASSNPAEDVGKIICSCFQVGEKTIKQCVVSGNKTSKSVGDKLQCGTNCGSCIPEINEIIRRV